MARKRVISPEFWTDEKIIQLEIPARLFMIGMLNHSDDEGIIHYSPLSLKAKIYPTDISITVELIENYIRAMLSLKIVEEGVDPQNQKLLKFVNWHEHQKINHPTPSKLIFTSLSNEDKSNSINPTVEVKEETVSTPSQYKIKEYNINKDNISVSSKKNLEKQIKQDFTFEHLYSIYPIKKNKQMALNAYKRIPKKSLEEFNKGLERHIEYWKKYDVDKTFIPHLSTFINKKRWDDELLIPTSDKPKFKDDMDRQIHERNENQVQQTKRLRAYLDKATEDATDNVPDLTAGLKQYRESKSNAQSIGEVIRQMDPIPEANTSTDGK